MEAEASNALESKQKFESELVKSLNIDSWTTGLNLNDLYSRLELEKEVVESLNNEDKARAILREKIIHEFANSQANIPYSGLYNVEPDQIQKAHYGLLFNGGVEATDGTIVTHDTIPLTVTQIGVCLVSYNGEQGAYAHRIYRKDLRIKGDDPLNDVIELLNQRRTRGAQGIEENSNTISSLAQRGLMAYAERAILTKKSQARWLMGHGHPFPYELLTGFWASRSEMTEAALELMSQIVKHETFLFIPSAPSRRELITLGNALNPLEYIIIGTVQKDIEYLIEKGGARSDKRNMQMDFASKYASQVVYGLYRASQTAPAYLFYAHKDYAQTAALIAISDSLLQEHRGFPMLIDIADNICTATFDPGAFYSSIRNAYAEAGQPFRFLSERETRNK